MKHEKTIELIIISIFVFLIPISICVFILIYSRTPRKPNCDYYREKKLEEYCGLITNKFYVKGDSGYVININNDERKIYGVNKSVDVYSRVGDYICKIKNTNSCVIVRKNTKKYFEKYYYLIWDSDKIYCDSIDKIIQQQGK